MYSTAEAATILRISRVEVFRRIKAGKINAQKVGRNYVVPYNSVTDALGEGLGTDKRDEIDKVIDKASKEYEETFKRLSKE
ncbi:MAG: helix-turn-helix domain-containing protein [Patescibacteria group bacterium]